MIHPSRDEIATIVGKARDAIMKRADSTPLSIRQQASLKESTASGPWCVSHTTLPAPRHEEGDATDVLMKAIVWHDQEARICSTPSAKDIIAEWSTYCESGPPQAASDHAKYDWISAQSQSRPIIFYIQGGAFVSGPPLLIRQIIYSLVRQAEYAS